MQRRAVHMVFSYCEYIDLFANLDDAKAKAEQLKDRVGSGTMVTNYLTLKELQEVLEHEISDEEWDEFKPKDVTQ